MIHARICPRRATCMHMRKCMVLSCTCIRVQGSCNHAVTQHRQSPWPADEQPGLAVSRRDHDDAAEARRTPRAITFPPFVYTAYAAGCFLSVPAYMLREALSLTPAVPGPLLGFGSLLRRKIWHQLAGEHEVRGEPCASSSAPRAGTRMGYRKPLKVARGARARTGGPRAVLREGVLTALEPGLGNRVSGRVLVADFLPPHPVGR